MADQSYTDKPRTSEFANAVVLITGAASGIGQTCARLFALNGCQKLFLVDLSRPKLETTAALIERDGLYPQVELYDGSVADESSVKDMIDHCVEVFGRIDIACNNAGVSSMSARTHEATMADFDFTCSVNERGVFLCEKYEIAQMLQQTPSIANQKGSIVNTASIAGHCIIPTASPYGASKHAVVALTRCDALRHIQDGIRVNCVSPGPVWTPMLSEGGLPEEFIQLTKTMAPMHRFVEAREVADAILFLGGPRGSAISGVNLPVDCGNQLIRSI
ncbi:hypothetical protein EDD36DRAFT_423989 [Exophiala viscosa]|uniref:Uncharacterized protein n=1 Tax=Exophiala viscosa TaxID=2486360 RepID=A0AAN6IHK9_9EURO|nr:hypothetical protein EDD36DRAFT_423989 [Exophiala viscosa]